MASDPTNGGRPDANAGRGVVVRIFSNAAEADAAAAFLNAYGISARLRSDACGGMLPTMDLVRGIHLEVDPADAQKAKELLAAEPVASPPGPSEASVQPGGPARASWFPPFLAGLLLGVLGCLLYQRMERHGMKTLVYDNDTDGLTDEMIRSQDGAAVEGANDRDRSTAWDSWTRFDSEGRTVSYQEDNNFDGKPDSWLYYTNNVLGFSEMDTDFNGVPDVSSFYKKGVVVQSDWRPNGTNPVVLRHTYNKGVLTEEWRDRDGDGQFDTKTVFDAFQNPVATNAPP